MVLEWQGLVSRFQNSCEKVKSDLWGPFEPRSKKYQNLTISEAPNRREIVFLKFENFKIKWFLFCAIVPHQLWVFVPKIKILGPTQLQI